MFQNVVKLTVRGNGVRCCPHCGMALEKNTENGYVYWICVTRPPNCPGYVESDEDSLIDTGQMQTLLRPVHGMKGAGR